MPRILFEFNLGDPEEGLLFEEVFRRLRSEHRGQVARANLGATGLIRADLPTMANPPEQTAQERDDVRNRQIEELFRLSNLGIPVSTLLDHPQLTVLPLAPEADQFPIRTFPVTAPRVMPFYVPLTEAETRLASTPISPLTTTEASITTTASVNLALSLRKAALADIQRELEKTVWKKEPPSEPAPKKSRFDLMGDD